MRTPIRDRPARQLLGGRELLVMPCCFDGLSARMIARAGFPAHLHERLRGVRGAPRPARYRADFLWRDGGPGAQYLRRRRYSRHRRRRHGLRQPGQCPPHGTGLCRRRLRRGDDRGPGGAEALRPYPGQGGGGAGGGLSAYPRRGGCPR